MKSRNLLCIGLFMALLAIPSCVDENSTFGNKLVQPSFRSVMTDTCTVLVSAMKIDSLETSGSGVILAGQYTHPLWGGITSTSFVPYNRPGYTPNIDKTVAFDSLTLRLSYGDYFIGDTTGLFSLSIHFLTEQVELNSKGYLYNVNSIAYDPDPFAVLTFRPRPNGPEKHLDEVRLPDEMGEDLLERLNKKDLSVSTDRFEEFFPGLAIRTEQDQNAIFSFSQGDTLSTIILYYHYLEEVDTQHSVHIVPNQTKQFNNFSHNTTGTPLATLDQNAYEWRSGIMGNYGLLFGGLGWYSKLEFPHLNNLMQLGSQIEIEAAYLMISPDLEVYSGYDYNALPDSIYLYIADENNVVTDAVMDYLGSQLQTATLYEDNSHPENTYYYFDVTDFMSQELGAVGREKHNLQLTFDSNTYIKTFRNLTYNDMEGKSPIKLQITYTIYDSF